MSLYETQFFFPDQITHATLKQPLKPPSERN